jgi:hypothetical protein
MFSSTETARVAILRHERLARAWHRKNLRRRRVPACLRFASPVERPVLLRITDTQLTPYVRRLPKFFTPELWKLLEKGSQESQPISLELT